MARHLGPRLVQCYHCRHRFEVSSRAQSTSCPGCNKPLMVGDELITKLRGPLKELKTCGRIVVSKRGRLIAETIEAHGGIDCQGIIDAKHVLSGTTVTLGPKSNYHGDLTAPGVVMHKGAKVKPSRFAVPEDPLNLARMAETGETGEPG